MTIHITWLGLFAGIGVIAVAVVVGYILIGLFVLLFWGRL